MIVGGFAVYPLLNLYKMRIDKAPGWMQSEEENLLVQWQALSDTQHHHIKLVHYTAECPVCKGTISIEKGGLRFPGRLVGKCNNSPREHCFSFDHITRKGNRL